MDTNHNPWQAASQEVGSNQHKQSDDVGRQASASLNNRDNKPMLYLVNIKGSARWRSLSASNMKMPHRRRENTIANNNDDDDKT